MPVPYGFKPADFGGEVDEICNRSDKPLFKRAELVWSKPQAMSDNENPFSDENRPILYAIVRNHHSMAQKDQIAYIGLSSNPKSRFANHPTAKNLAKKRGETTLSYAFLDVGRSSSRIETVKAALEQIEHILIWALFEAQYLHNDRKLFTLPGMGSRGGDAWQIVNRGYRFRGQMPREIVYPWMLIRHGRDRSIKSASFRQ